MSTGLQNLNETTSTSVLSENPERVRSALSHLSPEDRDLWLRMGMASKSGLGEDGFEPWDDWGSQSAAHNANDARSVWKSIKAGGKVTLGTLFYEAKQAGWKDDAAYKKPLAAEIERRRQVREQREAEVAQQKAAEQGAAAAKAKKLWDAAKPCDTHPYLERKGVKSHGLRFGDFEIERTDPNTGEVVIATFAALLAPIMDRSGKIWTVQAVSGKPGGPKMLLKGGKKSGNFFVIGKPKVIDGRPVFVLAEGYATAASVHEASGHMVLMCVDAGNLLSVASIVRERASNATILIAADNDTETDGNPGLSAARKAAIAVGGLVAFPPDGGDFNDLHLSAGLEAVADVIAAAWLQAHAKAGGVTSIACPPGDVLVPTEGALALPHAGQRDDSSTVDEDHFRILGFQGEDYFLYHNAKRQVISRTRKDFTEVGLIELAPIDWWEVNFPSKHGMDKTRAVEWIFMVAHKRGTFDPENRMRGRGAWNDGTRIVFHHGDHLTVDNVSMDLSAMPGHYVYDASAPLSALGQATTDAEGQHLFFVAQMARWKCPSSAMLLAGWVFLAPICGALKWRPHIWVSGPAGSGKSSLLDRYVAPLLGRLKLQVDGGDSTAAGIRQMLRCDARPVTIDEAESSTDAGRARIREILTLARGASSATDGSVVKGTVGGKAMEFRTQSMFCLGSIGAVLAAKESDASRFALLELNGHKRDGKNCDNWPEMSRALSALAADKDWPGRLLARALNMAGVIYECIDIFSAAVAERLEGNRRHGDQYGTLLAGYWCLCHGTAVTLEMAQEIVARIHFDDYVGGNVGPDASRCLDQLLDVSIVEKGSSVPVRTLVGIAAGHQCPDVGISAGRAKQMLQDRGMTITKQGDNGRYFAVIRGASSIGTLLRGTPFESDWQSHLPRIEGYQSLPATSFGMGRKNRAFGFPLHLIVTSPDDEPPI